MILILGAAGQNKKEYAQKQYPGMKILENYHETVKEQLQAGMDPQQEARRLCQEGEDVVVITDEIGCGIVPMDRFERTWREQSGRVNCIFAQQSETVIRLIAGIPQKLK